LPEGHTIHRLAARYRSFFAGRAVAVQSPQGRFAAGAAVLDGSVLTDTEAVGKHLLFTFGDSRTSQHRTFGDSRTSQHRTFGDSRTSQRRSGGHTLHIHLGLYGKFSDGRTPAPPVVGEVRLRVIGPDHWLDLRGPATCELLTPAEVEALRDRLGADPLRLARTRSPGSAAARPRSRNSSSIRRSWPGPG
jgi:endonuclease-8